MEIFISISSTGALGAGDSSAKFLVIVHLFDCRCTTMVATIESYDSTPVRALLEERIKRHLTHANTPSPV